MKNTYILTKYANYIMEIILVHFNSHIHHRVLIVYVYENESSEMKQEFDPVQLFPHPHIHFGPTPKLNPWEEE